MVSGMDLDLIKLIDNLNVRIPVIFSGGIGSVDDIVDAYNSGANEAIAISHLLNIENESISTIKKKLKLIQINVRMDNE